MPRTVSCENLTLLHTRKHELGFKGEAISRDVISIGKMGDALPKTLRNVVRTGNV